MYKTRNLPNTRIDVADALRGIAVGGIILYHSVEHFNIFTKEPIAHALASDQTEANVLAWLLSGTSYIETGDQITSMLAPPLALRDGIVVETLAEPVRIFYLVCHHPFSFRVQRYGKFIATQLHSYEPLSGPRLRLLDSEVDRIVSFRGSLKIFKACICQNLGNLIYWQDIHRFYLFCPVAHGRTGVVGIGEHEHTSGLQHTIYL